jgi:hypothetical protein
MNVRHFSQLLEPININFNMKKNHNQYEATAIFAGIVKKAVTCGIPTKREAVHLQYSA